MMNRRKRTITSSDPRECIMEFMSALLDARIDPMTIVESNLEVGVAILFSHMCALGWSIAKMDETLDGVISAMRVHMATLQAREGHRNG